MRIHKNVDKTNNKLPIIKYNLESLE
jgi:hypothetical protein